MDDQHDVNVNQDISQNDLFEQDDETEIDISSLSPEEQNAYYRMQQLGQQQSGFITGRRYIGGEGAEYPQDIGTTMTDNDYINLLRDITDPNLRKQVDHYLKYNPLTPAATHKLKVYYRGVLNMGLVASNIRNATDFERLMDRYLIIKCELPLGLTCYDVNETFTHIINIIDLNFFNQELRAVGGFHMKRIATTTSESVQHDVPGVGYEGQRVQEQSMLNKLTQFVK